jgi:hypothetical protein
MRTLNGWTEKDIQMLIARTARSEEAIQRFCRAVDKQLYLLLPEHIKRATLHFHLSPKQVNGQSSPPDRTSQNMTHHVDTNTKDRTENIIYLQPYQSNTKKGPRY